MASAPEVGGGRDSIEALAGEYLERYRRGDWPRMEEYIRRRPDLEARIREVFPSLLMRERVGGPAAPDAETPAAPPPSRRIGPYDTLLLLGRGGQGEVYLAEDSRLGRRVALKVIPRSLAPTQRMLDRFRREASITARLDHPGICTVYEAGDADGIPYIAMRYVEGETLAQWVALTRGDRPDEGSADRSEERVRVSHAVSESVGNVRQRDGLLRVVEIVEKAARALHAAHEAGLVHRDIKPGNIIVTPGREPVILDFGLAREEDDASALTMTGTLLGTPAYMSPEQLTAQRIPLDRRTDVYSLGVTLFEAITLRLPFEAATREQLYQKILTSEPDDPRGHNPAIPPDLRVVLETALEKDRDRRYATALAFAEDLRRVRATEPILARPAGPWLRTRRWAQRNPATATAATGLFAALAGGFALTAVLLADTRRERDAKETALGEARDQRSRAETERDEKVKALRRARATGLASASAAIQDSDPMLALLLAVEAGRTEMLPAVATRLHAVLTEVRERATIVLPPGGRPSAEFSPAGDRVLAACSDGTARIHDLGGKEIAVLRGHAKPVVRARFSPAGDRVLTASEDGTARVFEASGREVAVISGHGGPLTEAAWSPAGDRVATADDRGVVRLSDPRTGAALATLAGHEGTVSALAWAPDGAILATGGKDGTVRTWSADGAAGLVLAVDPRPASLKDRGSLVSRVRWSTAGDRLLACAWDGTARLWDRGGAEVAVLVDPEGAGNSISDGAFSPDGARIALASVSHIGSLWLKDGTDFRGRKDEKPLKELVGHDSAMWGISFSPAGDGFLTIASDQTARLWDMDGEPVAVLRGHGGGLSSGAWSPDGRHVVTASSDGTARVWEVRAGESAVFPTGHGHLLGGARFSPDGSRIATGSFDGTARVFDRDGRRLAVLSEHGDVVRCPVWSPSGELLLTVSNDKTARTWAPDGTSRAVLRGHSEALSGGTFSPEGDRIATTSWDGTARLWDLEGRLLATIEGEPVSVDDRTTMSPVFAPSGGVLGFGTSAGRALLVEPDGSVRAVLAGHKGPLNSVSFSPAGDRVATASMDRTVRIWDAKSGAQLLCLEGHGGSVGGAKFSADGTRVLTFSGDHTARLWDAATGKELARFRGHSSAVTGAAFFPPGDRVITESRDGSVRLWDLEGREQAVLRVADSDLRGLSITRSGDLIVTGHTDHTLRIWFPDPAKVLEVAEARVLRDFTPAERARYADLLGEAGKR